MLFGQAPVSCFASDVVPQVEKGMNSASSKAHVILEGEYHGDIMALVLNQNRFSLHLVEDCVETFARLRRGDAFHRLLRDPARGMSIGARLSFRRNGFSRRFNVSCVGL